MKALVLAGGSGTRLRPITHTSAKQLVPLANKPILFYGIEAIVAAGVTDIGIVVGDTAPEVMEAVGDGSRWGARITYIRQDRPEGLAHAVQIARDFLADDPFVMYLGDNFLIGGITTFVREFEEHLPDAQVLLTAVEEPQHFGVAELNEDGSLIRLVEKPKDPPSDLALVGVYLFSPRIHDAVRAIPRSWRNELEITDAIQWLIESGDTVRSHVLKRPWIDTGKRQEVLEANRMVLETLETRIDGQVDALSRLTGAVQVEAGAIVENSVIRGPAVIGEGTRISNSYVGPFSSIGPDCVIEESEVEHSVLLAGAKLLGVARVDDSLIGREVVVRRRERRPQVYRFMLGDHSEAVVP